MATSGKFWAERSAAGDGQLSATVMPATATTSDAATAMTGRLRQSGPWRRCPSTPSIGTSGAPWPSA